MRFLEDEELAYVATRAREVHDFWHVLFGCHTDTFGELALKAVEFTQVCNQEMLMSSPLFDVATLGCQCQHM